jgi:hypothetical protein
MKNIDNLVNKVLNEEIERKAEEMVSMITEKLQGGQKKLDVAKPKGKLDAADFKMLRSMKKKETKEGKSMCEQCGGVMKEGVCEQCGMNEEVGEGNAFTGALAKAKESGKSSFEVGGKEFQVKEGKNTLQLTESEVVDLIEKIVLEQKKKKEDTVKVEKVVNKLKSNIAKKEAIGLVKTEKGHLKPSKKENDDYISSVTKKMKEYLKNGSKGSFEMNPKQFPKGNGELGEMNKKAYTPSNAVEEYIENFAYAPGMENLQYDEIKPNKEWVDDNIKGSSRTGNNPEWANAVETELGEKIVKKKDKNLYGTEKRKNSYKRQTQPIDTAGEHEGEKTIDDMFTKLESVKEKKDKVLNEQISKMKNIIGYNKTTQ